MERTIALVVCLMLGAAIAWLGEQGPRARPADAPADVFSAHRALADIEIIAKAPHPTGSPANFAVREYLMAQRSRSPAPSLRGRLQARPMSPAPASRT